MTSSIAYRHCSAFVLVWVTCIAVQLTDVRAQSSSEVCLPNQHTSMPTQKVKSVQKSVRVKPKSPAVDWTTMASTYTHDATGQRIDQHTRAMEPESNERADFGGSEVLEVHSKLDLVPTTTTPRKLGVQPSVRMANGVIRIGHTRSPTVHGVHSFPTSSPMA